MQPPRSIVVENRKYVWDGAVHRDEAEASRVAATYRESRFDVQIMGEGSEWFVFTRREAAGDPAAR